MTLKTFGETLSKIVLAFVEYSFKCCAFLAAIITLGIKGSLLEKIVSGFSAVPAVLSQTPRIFQQLIDMGSIIEDYNSQMLSEFIEIHGTNTIDGVMLTLNEAVLFFGNISQNMSENPSSTYAATLTVFSTLFVVGLILGFLRRGGQVPVLYRMEKKLWNKLFEEEEVVKKAEEPGVVNEDEESEHVVQESNSESESQSFSYPAQDTMEEEESEPVAQTPTSTQIAETDTEDIDKEIQADREVKEFNEISDEFEEETETEITNGVDEEEESADVGLETKTQMESREESNEESETESPKLLESSNYKNGEDSDEKELSEPEDSGTDSTQEETGIQPQKDYSLEEYLKIARDSSV